MLEHRILKAFFKPEPLNVTDGYTPQRDARAIFTLLGFAVNVCWVIVLLGV